VLDSAHSPWAVFDVAVVITSATCQELYFASCDVVAAIPSSAVETDGKLRWEAI
jgi:hypothetical protein